MEVCRARFICARETPGCAAHRCQHDTVCLRYGVCLFSGIPVVFGFITASAPQGVAVMTDIDKYLSFVLTMFMRLRYFPSAGSGSAAVRMGIVSVEKLREYAPT